MADILALRMNIGMVKLSAYATGQLADRLMASMVLDISLLVAVSWLMRDSG